MPITLIRDSERFEVDYEGEAQFVLRRLSHAKRQQFVDACTRRGVLDNEKLGLMTLMHCILSWKGVFDEHGEAAPVTEENVAELPPLVVEFIAKKLNENLDGGRRLDPTKTSASGSEPSRLTPAGGAEVVDPNFGS